MKEPAECCRIPQKLFWKNRLFITASVSVIVVIASYFISILASFRGVFFNYWQKIWWAVLLGFLLGGVIEHYIPREYVSRVLSRKKPSTIFNAVFLGFLMSACSHGILALSIQLHKKGASNPAVVSFLLASPWANFAVTVMLISLFGLKGLIIVLAAMIVAVNTGFIFMLLERKGWIEKNINIVDVAPGFSILRDFKSRAAVYKFRLSYFIADFKGIIRGSAALADMVLWWIILGIMIASLAGAYIPVHFFHKYMGPSLLGMLVTLALATVIEVCSEGSSPLAFEIYRQTRSIGNSFIFLMAGVVTDYTEVGLLWTNVGRRVALWLPVVSVPQVLLIAYIMNRFLGW